MHYFVENSGMLRTISCVLALCILFACKSRKADLSGDEPLEAEDFIESFAELKLPFMLYDSSLARKPKDSFLISKKVFAQFVPDSVYRHDFGKGGTPRFYSLGRVSVEDGETYLFIKAMSSARNVGYILCFDKLDSFRAAMPLIYSTGDRTVQQEGGMDRRYSVVRNRTRRKPDGSMVYNKSVYVYNTAGVFTLILTESNETVEQKEVYNPIDTLPRKNSLSGNYVKDKKNFVSIRDGRRAGQLLFFVHIEKNNGDCTGELKGELDLVKPTIAQYRKADDHCELEFSFTSGSVTMRELEACGNHRGIKCVFDGTFPKKREPKKAASKSSRKK
jgi:hypothetical protein